MYRRVFVQSVAASAMWCAGSAAARAQSGMPLRVVFPFPAGGSGGALARMVADWLAAGMGQPAIVENKPGAGGRIGVQMVRNAAPDGMTLLVSPIAPMAVTSMSTSRSATIRSPTSGPSRSSPRSSSGSPSAPACPHARWPSLWRG